MPLYFRIMEEKKTVTDKRTVRERFIKALLVVTIAMIWGQSMISREGSRRESDALLVFLKPFIDIRIGDLGSETYEMLSNIVRKLAHITEYTILGCEIMAYRIVKSGSEFKRGQMMQLLFWGMLVGLLDETIQVFSGRGPMVTDVWIDTFGVLLGLSISRFIFKIIRSRK